MNSLDQHATRLRRVIGIGLLLFLIAAPAQANRIVQIRVGNHPTFTRLVFEMDAFTGYQVQRQAEADGTEKLTVTLEASTPPRNIISKSVGIESVQIAEGVGQAIAQIKLRKSGFQMKEMILSNPPRIVLDFVHSAAAVAELTGDPYAKPTPVEPKPAVTKVVKPKPEDVKKWYKKDQWNVMTVSALGKRIVVHVNGMKTAELKNDPGRLEGYIGVQLHGGQEMHVEFRKIEILTKSQ